MTGRVPRQALVHVKTLHIKQTTKIFGHFPAKINKRVMFLSRIVSFIASASRGDHHGTEKALSDVECL